MRSTRPILLLLLILAGGSLAGCYRTAAREPFARRDPGVEVEGLPRAAAGLAGGLGLTTRNTFNTFFSSSPDYLTWARALNDPEATPDEVREAVIGLTRYDYGRKPPYTEAYAQIAARSPDALVRAAAVRALNISRDSSAVPLFIERLGDESPRVRLEAAKALANVSHADAAGPLLARAQDGAEDLDVRIAAIDALRHYDDQELKRSLTRLLESEDFSVAWQARRSLVTLTGRDHGFDIDAWRRAVG